MLWRQTLNEIRTRKLALARFCPRNGMPVMPPLGASPREIDTVRKKLGGALPPSYADFLASHDGWPQLVHGVSLLGVNHIARGTYDGIAQMVVDLGDTPVSPNASRPFPQTVVPFGIDGEAETIFAWDTSVVRAGGELEVIAWVNQIGARFDGFPSLLEFVRDLLDADLASLKNQHIEPVPARARTQVEAPRSSRRRIRAA
jgi:hypothetical protein